MSPPGPLRPSTRSSPSLPPSDPPEPFSESEDGGEDLASENELKDLDDDEDAEGEDLFGENLMECVMSHQDL